MAFKFGRSHKSKARIIADLFGVNNILNDNNTSITADRVVENEANTSLKVVSTTVSELELDMDTMMSVANTQALFNSLSSNTDSKLGDVNTNLDQKLGATASITLTGAVTGSGSFSSNSVSIETTSNPTLTLSGDVTGSATFTNLGDATLTATVANDSHTHDSRYYTETEADSRFVNTAGDTMSGNLDMGDNNVNSVGKLNFNNHEGTDYGVSGDVMFDENFYSDAEYGATWSGGDGGGLAVYNQDGWGRILTDRNIQWHTATFDGLKIGSNKVFHDGYHPNADKWTTSRTLSLSGDASGSVSWDGSGNATLSVTVADDSHRHVISNIDGLQSALDGKLSTSGKAADSNLLDGINSSNFLRSNVADTMTGLLTMSHAGNEMLRLRDTSASGSPYISWYQADTRKGYMQFVDSGNRMRIYNDHHDDYIDLMGGVNGLKHNADGTEYTVWTSGNDGSGSGLDADRVDGLQASSFVRSDASDTMGGGTYTVSSGTDQKFILAGATNPYIRWQESSTNRFYIQWRADRDAPLFRNQQADNFEFMPDAATGAVSIRLLGSDNDIWGSLYANDSQHVGILDEGGSWAIRHQNNQGNRFYSDGSTLMFSMGVDLQPGEYGTVGTHGGGENGWEGYSINGRYVFMSDDNETVGIYNDVDNRWIMLHERADRTDMYDPDANSVWTRWDNGEVYQYIHMRWTDNDKIYLGSGADFRMWHDGSHHYFRNYNHGNGNIYWQGEDNEGSNHALLYMYTNGSRPYLRFYENGGERMRTTSGGVTVYGSLTQTSDERYKKNIEKIEEALDKIKQIDGVTFDWDNDAFPEPDNEDGGFQTKPDFDKRSAGVIAQRVESVLPEAVTEDPETGFKNVAYGNLVGLLIEGIKEIDDRLSTVEQRLDNIEDTS